MLTFLVFLMLIGLGIALAVHFGYWDKWMGYTKKILDGNIFDKATVEDDEEEEEELPSPTQAPTPIQTQAPIPTQTQTQTQTPSPTQPGNENFKDHKKNSAKDDLRRAENEVRKANERLERARAAMVINNRKNKVERVDKPAKKQVRKPNNNAPNKARRVDKPKQAVKQLEKNKNSRELEKKQNNNPDEVPYDEIDDYPESEVNSKFDADNMTNDEIPEDILPEQEDYYYDESNEVENFVDAPRYYTKEEFGDISNLDGMCNSNAFVNCGSW